MTLQSKENFLIPIRRRFKLIGERNDEAEESDTQILMKLRSTRIKLLNQQIKLCREENRYRHNVQIVMTLANLAALLTGGIVAASIALFPK